MDELYQQYSQIVFQFLYARCHDRELAQDLMQETFLRAIQCLDSYDKSCRLSTWLCQIAKHLLYQHWAKSGRARLEELDETLESGYDTEQHALAKVELADVWERLRKLPPEMRKTVELREIGRAHV